MWLWNCSCFCWTRLLMIVSNMLFTLSRNAGQNFDIDAPEACVINNNGIYLLCFSEEWIAKRHKSILERFHGILHEGVIGKWVQFLIEGLMTITKAKFQGCPAVRPELDLVKQKDRLTHEISVLEEIDPEVALDIFKPDPQFLKNEEHYKELKKTIIDEESDNAADLETGSDDEDGDESDEEEAEKMKVKDETEMSINLPTKICLAVTCSVNYEEVGHQLLNMKL